MECLDNTIKENFPCLKNKCRHWINFASELNCIHISIMKYKTLTFEQIGDRLDLTPARIKQIEQETFAKLSKRSSFLKILEE